MASSAAPAVWASAYRSTATLLGPALVGVHATLEANPWHVVLETVCIVTILYLLLHRRFNPNAKEHQRLTPDVSSWNGPRRCHIIVGRIAS